MSESIVAGQLTIHVNKATPTQDKKVNMATSVQDKKVNTTTPAQDRQVNTATVVQDKKVNSRTEPSQTKKQPTNQTNKDGHLLFDKIQVKMTPPGSKTLALTQLRAGIVSQQNLSDCNL